MATPISTVATAATPVTLGGKEYRMSPLRLNDWADFEAWCKSQIIRAVASGIEGLPEAIQEKALAEASSQAARFNVSNVADAQRFFRTLDGATRVVWLGLRRNHPDLTIDQLRELLNDSFAETMAVFNRINDSGKVGKGAAAPKLEGAEATPTT